MHCFIALSRSTSLSLLFIAPPLSLSSLCVIYCAFLRLILQWNPWWVCHNLSKSYKKYFILLYIPHQVSYEHHISCAKKDYHPFSTTHSCFCFRSFFFVDFDLMLAWNVMAWNVMAWDNNNNTKKKKACTDVWHIPLNYRYLSQWE